MRTERRTPIAITILIAGVGVGTTAGIAGGALKATSATTTVGDDSVPRSATATCKPGTKAVSGGFDAPGFDPLDGPFVVPLRSKRTAKREWSTTAFNYGDPGDLITYAYCSDTLPKLKLKSATVSVGPSAAETASVRCKKGGEAVSGGFVELSDPVNDIDTYQFESRRVGRRTWTVSAFNDDSTDSHPLTAVAYCARHKLGLKSRSATSTFDEDGENASAEAKCKKGTKAVSGGFSGLTTESETVETFPFRSRRTGRRKWGASAGGYSSLGATIDWTAFAYCLDKDEL